MCGIAGFVDKRGRLNPEEKRRTMEAMLSRVRHRGNDGTGMFVRDKLALGHVRLSILDVSSRADQPFISEDGERALSYNGELYNFRELDEALGKKKRTSSDTETFLHALERWGSNVFRHLRGMYAFAFADRESVLLGVDRHAIKPLYYIDTPDWFAWSSEAKALFVVPGIRPEFDEAALDEYLLFRQVSGSRTLWKNVKRFLPAEWMRIDAASGAITKRGSHWIDDPQPGAYEGDDALREQLIDAVRSHLIADVPVGLQLSGGIDSSLVAVLAAELVPQERFHTFSIGLADDAWNEFPYSRRVAERIGSSHHELVFTPEDFRRELAIATYHLDEPVNHSHSVPMMLLAREAAKSVKVLLSGEGADEVLGGYKRYLDPRAHGTSPKEVIMISAFATPQSVSRVLGRAAAPDLAFRLSSLGSAALPMIERVLKSERQTYLFSMLVRQDKMGMASTLENRVPFLDVPLVDFASRMPTAEKIGSGHTKIAPKRLARDFFDEAFVYRPKVGFGQPIADWLRRPKILGDMLCLALDHEAFVAPHLDQKAIKKLYDEHCSGQDHSSILWPVLTLELWGRIFQQGTDPATLT
ncbi:asparagine synthase (glutamine-hydrolyzing) [Candidatus Uhrbacteria bacterium]|nr:MAG: asparagine synthase (glutamine-hydrolyzing) [Candidatus Uhrbacteria bacterium]